MLTVLQQLRHHADAAVEEVATGGHHLQCLRPLPEGEEYRTTDQAKPNGHKPYFRAPCVTPEVVNARREIERCPWRNVHRRGTGTDGYMSRWRPL